MHIHIEKYFPCDLSYLNNTQSSFVRLNLLCPEELASFLQSDKVPNVIPVLTAFNIRERTYDYKQLIDSHVEISELLSKRGYKHIVLSADDDGVWQKSLSPRYVKEDLKKRMQSFLLCYEALKNIIEELWVLITLEELAPGGLDATDGLAVLHELQKRGLKETVIASGTRDFLPLFNRRATQKKGDHADFCSHEPDLASASWAVKYSDLKVWSLAKLHDEEHAKAIANKLGLAGLIKREIQPLT